MRSLVLQKRQKEYIFFKVGESGTNMKAYLITKQTSSLTSTVINKLQVYQTVINKLQVYHFFLVQIDAIFLTQIFYL